MCHFPAVVRQGDAVGPRAGNSIRPAEREATDPVWDT